MMSTTVFEEITRSEQLLENIFPPFLVDMILKDKYTIYEYVCKFCKLDSNHFMCSLILCAPTSCAINYQKHQSAPSLRQNAKGTQNPNNNSGGDGGPKSGDPLPLANGEEEDGIVTKTAKSARKKAKAGMKAVKDGVSEYKRKKYSSQRQTEAGIEMVELGERKKEKSRDHESSSKSKKTC